MSGNSSDKKTPELRKSVPWQLVGIFLLFSAAIILVGSLYYISQKNRIFKEEENNLAAIASLKISQIESWRRERLGDAAVIGHDKPLIKSITSLLSSTSKEAKTDIRDWMKSVRNEYDYKNVLIADTSFKVRLSVIASDTVLGDSIRKELKTIFKSHAPFLTDLHVSKEIPYIHLDIFIPLFDSVYKNQVPIGVVVLRIDPNKILFPLIQSWPTQSKSSETLLLRKEGDSVLYLNELRHTKNTALKLKLPLSNKNLLATKAVFGLEGLTEGIDYRNIPVIGSIQKIPETPWYMVAKVDKEEILLPLQRYVLLIIIVVVLLILINASIFGFWIWHQRIKFYRSQLRNEVSIRELEEKFTTAFRMSPVSVTISSVSDNKFIDVNNTFLRDMEYEREEVIGRTAKELNIWADEKEREWIINEIGEKGKVFGKVISYKTRTGKILYGLSSMSVVNVNGEPCNLSTVVNVTDARANERKLAEQYFTLKGITESSRGPIFSLDKSYCYTSFNKVHSNVMKFLYGADIGIGKNMLNYQTNDDDRIKAKANLDRAMSGEYVEESAWSGEDFKSRRFFEVTHNPIFNDVNEVIGVAVNARDITERKLIEEKLRETNEYLSNLFNYANAPIIVWDTSLLITRFNHAFENLSGYSADEVIGKKIDILFPKEEIKSSLSLIKEAISGERWETVEIEIQRKDGESRIVLWNSANIHDKDGKSVIATIAQGHDITVRKQAENSLKESEMLLQSIIDNSNSLIYIVDAEGRFINVNQPLLKLLSATQSQLIGQTREVFLPKEIAEIHRKNDLEVIKSKKTQVFEEENIEPDGKHYYLTTKFPLYNNKHVIYAVGGLSTDITGRKIAEELVRESENKLREAQEMAHLGFWKWDIKSGDVEWSEEVYKIFHLDPKKFKPQIDSILSLSPWEEDNNRNTELINRAIKSHEPGDYEQKFLRPDNSIGYYYSTFQGKYDENGDLIRIVGTVLDITERKLTESALGESEERFRTLYENATIGIYRTTADGKILMANPALVNMLGFESFEELAKRNLEKEGYEPDYPRKKFIATLEKQGRIIGLESAWHKRDGSTLYVRESAVAIRDDKGKILYYDGNVEDVTERKKTEEALRESEDKFKYIFDHSVIGKSITFPKGEIHVNKALCELLGYSEKELESKKWQDITHPEDIELTQKIMDSLISGEKKTARFNKRYIHKNGAIIWSDLGTALRRDDDGNPLYFLTAIIDITERKKAEESLRLKNFVFDDSIAANSIADIHGNITEVNAAFLRIWDYTVKDEVIGKPISHFIKDNSDSDSIVNALSEFGEWEGDYIALKNDGSTFIAHGLATRIKDEKGNTVGYQSAVLDVTESKNAEEIIHKLNEELEQKVIQRTELLAAANKELEAFSYSVSHDLRAPLRSVHGYTKILVEEYESMLDDEGKRICGIISSSATQMGELIDDLLSFSRIGRTSMNPSQLNMKSIVKSVFEEICPNNQKSRTNLKIGKLHKVSGDANLVKLVWTNLISNAIKYSSKENIPEISVSSQLKYDRITYSVTDNGVGFDMNYKHKLFGVFQRLHSESEFEGNGVGLAIVQRIILKHGGTVWAEGEVGKGATFYFSLPAVGDGQQAAGNRKTKGPMPDARRPMPDANTK